MESVIASSIAPLLSEPRATATQVSQTLFGHCVRVIAYQQPWLRLRSADGYEGWCHQGYLHAADVQTLQGADSTPAKVDAPGVELPEWGWDMRNAISLGVKMLSRNGEGFHLPLGARVDVLSDELREVNGDIVGAADRMRRFPQTGEAVVDSARTYFSSTSYQWGGITPWGADCSGMVQTIFALHGIRLPRDAHQQAHEGTEVHGGPESLHPGDLAFFSDREDGRITHVAISAGRAGLVHLALGRGGYREETLDSPDDYLTGLIARFTFARRMIRH